MIRSSLPPLTALVTAGPTREYIDPVRYITNESSGKQGIAIAEALAEQNIKVILVTGPTTEKISSSIQVVQIETAIEMLAACEALLPVDIAICVAAVADWRPVMRFKEKHKKLAHQEYWQLNLIRNPDILAHLGHHPLFRPELLIGFAAETNDCEAHARQKRTLKQCHWIVANQVDVNNPIFGSEENEITLITETTTEKLPKTSKTNIAKWLVRKIIEVIEPQGTQSR